MSQSGTLVVDATLIELAPDSETFTAQARTISAGIVESPMPVGAFMAKKQLGHLGLVAASCFLLVGCVQRSITQNEVTFRYQWWLPLGVFLGGAAAVLLGLILRKLNSAAMWVLVIGGPIVSLLFAPALLSEWVKVHDAGFEKSSGLYGLGDVHEISFDSVTTIRIEIEETEGRGRRLIEVLYLEMKKGPAYPLPLNNDVRIEAGKEIVTRAQRRGIPVIAPR